MADLTQFSEGPIVTAIYERYKAAGDSEESRGYLGASSIGDECARKLWYGFRWARKPQFDGRLYRLFQSGHLAEARFVADLRSIGAEVYDVDPASGKQFGFKDLGGHMRGHMDGAGRRIPSGGEKWHVLEFKTHNEKSFADLKKNQVKKAKPLHYAQMVVYMGWSTMERSLYLAVNKNTDELYAERIEFDPVLFQQLLVKGERIIFGQEPPPKLNEDPKFYLCNMCDFKDVCHGNQVPNLSCRTCVHSTPEREGDGRWSCAQHPEGRASTIPIHVQREGCPAHLPLPFLLTYADAVDAGHGWIEFKRKDTGEGFHVAVPGVQPAGPPLPTYTSQEISVLKDYRLLCDQGIEDLKQQYPGSRITG